MVLAQQAGWLPAPPGGPGTLPQCPRPAQWQLLYWGGAPTPINEAARACPGAGRFWRYQHGRWYGFNPALPQESDTWNVQTGEATFVQGGAEPASGTPARPSGSAISVSPDLERARGLVRDGRFDEAIPVYRALLTQLPPDLVTIAQMELAVSLLSARRLAEARDLLLALPPGRPAEGDYLLGRLYSELGQDDDAVGAYRRYVERDGILRPYAYRASARILETAGRYTEALAAVQAALAAELPGRLRREMLFSAGRLAEATDALATAREIYTAVLTEDAPAADRATALFRLGQIARNQGDPQWSDLFLRAVRDYPAAPASRQSLDALLAAGVSVDPLLQGIVRYRARENDAAWNAFQAVLDSRPSGERAAIALFYQGALLERRDDTPGAIALYAASQASDPSGDLADDASWWRAVLLEAANRLDEAAAAYEETARRYPQSRFAADAAFRSGLMLYRGGHYQEAAERWARLAQGSGEAAARAALWRGKALAATMAQGAAETAWTSAMDLAPQSIYGLRAAVLRGGTDPLLNVQTRSLTATPAPDMTAIRRWVNTWSMGTAPSMAELTADGHWKRGEALLTVGEARLARDEFALLSTRAADSPFYLVSFLEAYRAVGLTALALEMAIRLNQLAPPPSRPAAPEDFLHLLYPLDYQGPLQDAARRHGVPMGLLLAMIHQESGFDPTAVSPADARGLMQVMPATAREIATALNRLDFTVNDLHRPALSIEFGAYYLARQLAAANGNGYVALAAYNGGPGNAGRWWQQAGGDIDLFLEMIDFPETQSYVKIIATNYVRYRTLYGER